MTKQAFGIVSLLDTENNSNARLAWRRASEIIGKSGLSVPLYPHISWQVAKNYDVEKVAQRIEQVAGKLNSFKLQVSGLGIFPGFHPVLHLSVVRNQGLNKIHDMIWENCSEFAEELSPYYSAENWVPHITLAYEKLNPFDLSAIVEEMANETWDYQIEINNLAIVFQIGSDVGISKQVSLLEEGK